MNLWTIYTGAIYTILFGYCPKILVLLNSFNSLAIEICRKNVATLCPKVYYHVLVVNPVNKFLHHWSMVGFLITEQWQNDKIISELHMSARTDNHLYIKDR